MTSSNEDIFRVTDLSLWGEFPSQRPVMRSFDVFVDLHLNKRLKKDNRGAVDLRRHGAHYAVIVTIHWRCNQGYNY